MNNQSETGQFDRLMTGLSMAGKIRTKEKCPLCDGKFKSEHANDPLHCEKHPHTYPKRYFIDLFWKNERLKIYTNKEGEQLSSWDHATHLAKNIYKEIHADPPHFSMKDYRPENRADFKLDKQLNTWLSYIKSKGRSPRYTEGIEYYIEAFYKDFFKNIDVREITTTNIDDFYVYMKTYRIARYKKPKPLADKTIKNIINAFNQFLNNCKRRDIIVRVPAFEEIEVPEYDWKWLSEDMQDAIIESVDEEHRPILMFITRHGTRPGEAMAIDWDDIDFDRQVVRISKNWAFAKKDGYILKKTTKEDNIRYLPIDGGCFQWMVENRGISGPVYRRNKTDRYTHRTLGYWWYKGQTAIGMAEHIPLKDGSRHSVASQALDRGVDINAIKDFLGHKDLRTTSRRYAHRTAKTLIPVLSPGRPQAKSSEANPLKIKGKKS